MIRAVLRRALGEHGYTLVEMLTVMVIMGVVIGSLTTVFVSASNSELDMNARFQAQQNARLALDKIRREAHCARNGAPTGSGSGSTYSSVTLTLPSYCKTLPQPLPTPLPSYCSTTSGETTCSVTWCTRSVSTARYALFRVAGSTCGTSGGVKWADNLVTTSTAPACGTALCVFKYTSGSTASLAKLSVDFPVNARPAKPVDLYELIDDIALRNSSRS